MKSSRVLLAVLLVVTAIAGAHERPRDEASARLEAKRWSLEEQKRDVDRQKETDPQSWRAGQETYIAALEQLRIEDPSGAEATGLWSRIVLENARLGHFLRFRMRDPEAAIRRYQAARDAAQDDRWAPIHDSWIGDTYQ